MRVLMLALLAMCGCEPGEVEVKRITTCADTCKIGNARMLRVTAYACECSEKCEASR